MLILELSAYKCLCLFFTNFVLVFHKISRKRAYYNVFAVCPKKRGRFLVKDQVMIFFLGFDCAYFFITSDCSPGYSPCLLVEWFNRALFHCLM